MAGALFAQQVELLADTRRLDDLWGELGLGTVQLVVQITNVLIRLQRHMHAEEGLECEDKETNKVGGGEEGEGGGEGGEGEPQLKQQLKQTTNNKN